MSTMLIYMFIISGSLLFLIGATVAGLFGQIFTSVLNKMLVVDPNGRMFETFQSPPIVVHMDFYFFNVTNPEEVQYYGYKPILREVGPYSYKERIKRDDFTWNETASTTRYTERRTYEFDEINSIGRKTDKITILNPIMVIAAFEISKKPKIGRVIWPQIEKGMDLFETFEVDEVLFEGFTLPTFDFDFSPLGINRTANLSGTLYEIIQELTGDAPEILEENKFGFYHWMNGTAYGEFEVNTGKGGMEEYLHIQRYNNATELDFWQDEYCDMINGTDGTQFPPGVPRDTDLRLFTKDLCRSIYLKYEKDVEIYDVFEAFRFIAPEEMLQSPSKNPDNMCFCVLVPGDGDCLHDSMINVAPCYKGAPVILSTPHFYQGDPRDTENVEGLNPNKDEHETFLDLEPRTGVVINAAKRIQINLPLRTFDYFPSFKQVPSLVFPVLWGNENVKISHDEAVKLNNTLTGPFKVTYWVCGALMFAGVILASIGGVKYSKRHRK